MKSAMRKTHQLRHRTSTISLNSILARKDGSSKYERGEKLPFLVESVLLSNVLKVKVILITVVPKAENHAGLNNSVERALPQGTGKLVEKGYDRM